VTIGGNTYAVPTPFLVMATQNPIESEGTYPLPGRRSTASCSS
jgi:MoxR-like ATPase